ncbi:Ubiquinone/menaquinone biosynthesis C-methyltransferase UbiE [Metallosphaera sp. J1]|uniref:class I SAM-dependent methyltransferase n=1 Tax=Metallosphaera TaxID=41980 RepID=UPI001EDDDDEE|nr:class I SAM-dependent methyltransferase [Metallosphaera javensis (ex Hofmann et al. 2022)]MCG3108470.1 Ubiquinone/menaquinone biosynthesis C-methyltransferase UbiE [Metallosphaera javensis (ex Hofmann et al. 2022)]BCS92862.1 MAG: ubiquinone/menaquinone biosynthesis C-methyltransferase UbiE [Metallosphaera javensis (ex Sakai et al. 2022)]
MPTYYPVRRMGITLDEQNFILKRLAQLKVEGEVLDVGCGNSLIPIQLSKLWKRKITALDIWDEFPLETAVKNAEEEGAQVEFLKIERPDLKLPLKDSSFSFVYSVMFVYNLRKHERESLFTEIRRVLRDGGTFLLVDPVIVRRERTELKGFKEISYREENALFYYLARKE